MHLTSAYKIKSYLSGDKGKTIAVVGVGILSRFLTLLTLPLYTRSLSPQEYGVIGLCASLALFISLFSTLSLPSAAARFVIETENKVYRQNLLGSVLTSVLILGSIFCLSLILFGPFLLPNKIVIYSGNIRLLLVALSGEIFLRAISTTFSSYNLALKKHSNVALSEFTEQAVRHSILVSLTIFGALTPINYFIGGATGVACMALVLALPNLTNIKICFNTKIMRKCFAFSIPLAIHSSAYIGIHYLDRILLAPIVSPVLLGKYHLAYSLVFAPFSVVILLAKAWTPLSNLGFLKNNPKIYRAMSAALADVGILVAIITAVFLPIILSSFFKNNYQPPSGLIEILIAAELLYLIYTSSVTPLTYFQYNSFLPLITCFSLIINIALIIILAPKYGLLGAATATLFAFMVLGSATAICSHIKTGESLSFKTCITLVFSCLLLISFIASDTIKFAIGIPFVIYMVFRLTFDIRLFFSESSNLHN